MTKESTINAYHLIPDCPRSETRILTAMAPTSDEADRYFSTTATSVLWAFALLINDIDKGLFPRVNYVPRLYDPLRVKEKTWENFKSELEGEKPNVLALASTYDSHHNARTMCHIAKQMNPDLITIYGGPHIKEVAKDIVVQRIPQIYPFNEANPPLDFLVEGDGEFVLRELVSDIENYRGNLTDLKNFLGSDEGRQKYSKLPGKSRVHFKDRDNQVVKISTSNKPLRLSELPTMPRHLVDKNPLDLYGFSCFYERGANGQTVLLPSTSTLLHRGCQSGCYFCSERGGFNQRSVNHIVGELEDLQAKGIKGVFFDDSTVGDHRGFYDRLLPALQELGIQYASLNRFDKLQNPENVYKMRKAGWVYQYCSIEHLSDEVLKMSNKRQGIKEIETGISNMERIDMKLGVSLLFGLRRETENSIRRTLEFTAKYVDSGLISCVSMSLLSFHPGTPQTLVTPEGTSIHSKMRFDMDAPLTGEPWDQFEEGRWYHPEWVTEDRVRFISELANSLMGYKLVRNMRKDGVLYKDIESSGPKNGVIFESK